MNKIFLLAVVICASLSSVYAQGYEVKGQIKDSVAQEPLIGVNIILENPQNSENKYYATTDLEGHFSFLKVAPGAYSLTATYVGYKKFTQTVKVNAKPVNLGILGFLPDVKVMEGVVITGKAAKTILMGDTTRFNADAFKTAPDASGQDLVEKLPGITIEGGKLQAQGEDVQQILVDGKPFFGKDVNAALQNLPAEVIAGIEVFDKKSDKAALSGFDDGEKSKTINIVTKPNRRKGQFGKISAGYGTDNRYQMGASVNFFNEDRRITLTGLSNNINALRYSADPNSQGDSRTQDGIINTNSFGLNYSNDLGKKIQLSGSYYFTHRQNEIKTRTSRDYVSSDSGQVYTENLMSNNGNTNHWLDARLEYKIDSNNKLIVRPNISLRQNKSETNFLGKTVTDNGLLNQTENTSSGKNLDYDYENQINYSHGFSKKGRSFTLNVNTGYHTNKDRGNRLASNIYYDKADSLEVLNQITHLDRTGLSWNVDASYTEPVGKNGQMQLEYEVGDRVDDSDKRTYNIDEEVNNNLLDTALSNIFKSAYLTHKAELGYQYKIEKLRVQVEAEYQYASLKNDQEFPAPSNLKRSFSSILPTVRFDYKFSDSRNLEFDYDTRTNEPSIGQLQNVIDNSNPLHITSGNPDLDQAFSNRLRLKYKAANPATDASFFLYLSSSFDQKRVVSSSIIAQEPIFINNEITLEKGSQFTKPINIDGYWDLHSFVNYGKPWESIKSNVNINGSINYTKQPGMVNNVKNFVNSGYFRIGLSLSSNISEKIDFNISTQSKYNIVQNSLRPELNSNYFNQTTRLSYKWIFLNGFVYRTELKHEVNSGLSSGYDNSTLLLNMSIGRKFLKNDLAEISLNVYDLLGQNNNINRNVTELYVEDRKSTVLQRYFMLTFTYNIRHFSKGASMSDFKDNKKKRYN